MTNPYVPLLIMAAAALVLALGGLGASAIFGPTKKSRTKADNYECGIDPTEQHLERGRFPVRYYLVAMTFIVFDIEVVFMYPWAVMAVLTCQSQDFFNAGQCDACGQALFDTHVVLLRCPQ